MSARRPVISKLNLSLSIVQHTTICTSYTCVFRPTEGEVWSMVLSTMLTHTQYTHQSSNVVTCSSQDLGQRFNEQLYVSASRTLPHVQASLIPICLRPGFEPAISRTIVECFTNCAIWTAMVVTAEFDYSFFKFISRPPSAKNLVSNKLIRAKLPLWRQRRASARTSASLSLHGGKFNLYQLV